MTIQRQIIESLVKGFLSTKNLGVPMTLSEVFNSASAWIHGLQSLETYEVQGIADMDGMEFGRVRLTQWWWHQLPQMLVSQMINECRIVVCSWDVVGWMSWSVKSVFSHSTQLTPTPEFSWKGGLLKGSEYEWSCRNGPTVHQIGRDKSRCDR